MDPRSQIVLPHINQMDLDAPASVERLNYFVRNSGKKVSKEYLHFLRQHNGGEGFVGNSYIMLWRVEDLDHLNQAYEINTYCPGVFLFGSSGGGEAYGFDFEKTGLPIVQVPFVGMSRKHALFVAMNFAEFLIWLAVGTTGDTH